MLEYQPSMNDQGVSAVNGVNSEDRIRVQCLAAEIEILKRTISDLKFQLQAVQSVVSMSWPRYNYLQLHQSIKDVLFIF